MNFARTRFKISLVLLFAVALVVPPSHAGPLAQRRLSDRVFGREAPRPVADLEPSDGGYDLRLVRPLARGAQSLPLATAGRWIADLIEDRGNEAAPGDVAIVVESVARDFDLVDHLEDERVRPFFAALESVFAAADLGKKRLVEADRTTLLNIYLALRLAHAYGPRPTSDPNARVIENLADWICRAVCRLQRAQFARPRGLSDADAVKVLARLAEQTGTRGRVASPVWPRVIEKLRVGLESALDLSLDVQLARSSLRWELAGGAGGALGVAAVLALLRGSIDPATLQKGAIYGFLFATIGGPFVARTHFDFNVREGRRGRAHARLDRFVADCARALVD